MERRGPPRLELNIGPKSPKVEKRDGMSEARFLEDEAPPSPLRRLTDRLCSLRAGSPFDHENARLDHGVPPARTRRSSRAAADAT
jgi:hypothetical protein